MSTMYGEQYSHQIDFINSLATEHLEEFYDRDGDEAIERLMAAVGKAIAVFVRKKVSD